MKSLDIWLQTLHKAWGCGEVDLVLELFERCNIYMESPWEQIAISDLMTVWEGLRGQQAQKLTFEILFNDGEHSLVAWEYINHFGEESAGSLWLCFDAEGYCCQLRMWWMKKV